MTLKNDLGFEDTENMEIIDSGEELAKLQQGIGQDGKGDD